jgi:DNA adenine methylase
MKTPITYYGGKQQLAETITRLIPPHKIYVEPFIGGAAVYFAKPPSEVEVINDINNEVTNFYEVIKNDFAALYKEIEVTLYSREAHRRARVIYENPDMFDRVKRAWALWTRASMGFGADLLSGYGYSNSTRMVKSVKNRIENFTDQLSARLRNTEIECYDALKIIQARDTPETFFYCDPPYPETDQGHYDGYSNADFAALLETLTSIQGKFLLSSFRNEARTEKTAANNWSQFEITMNKAMSTNTERTLQKIEVFTANYSIEKEGYGLLGLFD